MGMNEGFSNIEPVDETFDYAAGLAEGAIMNNETGRAYWDDPVQNIIEEDERAEAIKEWIRREVAEMWNSKDYSGLTNLVYRAFRAEAITQKQYEDIQTSEWGLAFIKLEIAIKAPFVEPIKWEEWNNNDGSRDT